VPSHSPTGIPNWSIGWWNPAITLCTERPTRLKVRFSDSVASGPAARGDMGHAGAESASASHRHPVDDFRAEVIGEAFVDTDRVLDVVRPVLLGILKVR
jgi:hypothetical protein